MIERLPCRYFQKELVPVLLTPVKECVLTALLTAC